MTRTAELLVVFPNRLKHARRSPGCRRNDMPTDESERGLQRDSKRTNGFRGFGELGHLRSYLCGLSCSPELSV